MHIINRFSQMGRTMILFQPLHVIMRQMSEKISPYNKKNALLNSKTATTIFNENKLAKAVTKVRSKCKS